MAQRFYIWSGSECTAKANQGFDFVSWQENLGGNSSRVIQFASPPPFYEPILGALHLAPDKPEATLNITKFGSFTANFKALPPPIPPEYVATLFTVIATAFVGSWLTPAVIGWRKTRKQGNRLDNYHKRIKNLYNDGKLDKNDIGELNSLSDSIATEYTRGKITKEQYDKLVDEISLKYREIFTKEIDSLDNYYENDKIKLLSGIKINIDGMHANRKINNEHYSDLKKGISLSYENILKKKIDSLNNQEEDDKVKLVNELHYTLLKENISSYEKSKM